MRVPQTGAAAHENSLLASLADRERRRVIAACEEVELRSGSALTRQYEPVRHVYFPTGSVVSLLARTDGQRGTEVGLVGWEGAVGAILVLGVHVAPVGAIVQAAGSALRINAKQFVTELNRSPALSGMMSRYLYVFVSQLATTASCAQFHVVEARLARWLLMTRDRQRANEFYLTHDFIAYMLGVRRVGVTRAAHGLRGRALVSYSRGYIRILDVPGLEAVACPCYAANRETYARIMSRSR